MKVCIAEKPSVAREIAFILGAKNRNDGFFEGNGYAVTWTFGHFCTLKTPDDYKPEWKRWNLGTLPMLPMKFETKLISNAGVKKQFKIIKQLFKSAKLVINCGDAGTEGELIQRWVLNEAKYKGPIQRLWISSLTPEAIKEGFQNLKPNSDFDNLYFAGSSRAIGDWILGMNATRLYTLKYGAYKQLLSIGRVQTPTLAMLVYRYLEIMNFVSHPFWELQTIYRDVPFNCEKGKFLKKEDGEAFLKKVKDKDFTILSTTKKKGKEFPQRLFDLTSLQVQCNKQFAYSADKTLKIVQKLYEQKVVTYPRVDTTYLPNDQYPKISGILGKMKNYQQFVDPLLKKPIRKSNKVFNDKKVTDHHAIIPTGFEKQLYGDEQKVYDVIARRFIAAFYPDCIFSNTTVIGEVDGIKFKATGKEILEEGWRVLYPRKKQKQEGKKNDDDENTLPEFVKGESGPHKPDLIEKKTLPPKPYTEATLLRAMETAGKKVDNEEFRELMKENGIGRPSTRANIIETLFKREYIYRQKRYLYPTEKGVSLIQTIQNKLLTSAELTGRWEKKLREIEQGNFTAKQFIHDMKVMVDGLVKEVIAEKGKKVVFSTKATNAQLAKANSKPKSNNAKGKVSPLNATCPKCNAGKLLKGKTAYGCSQYKDGCKFIMPFEYMGKKISDNQLGRLLKYSSTVELKGFIDNGKKINGKIYFNKNFEFHFMEKTQKKSPDKPMVSARKTPITASNKSTPQKPKEVIPCPKCKKGNIIKGKTAYGCTDWKAGCKFLFPFDEIRKKANGKKLTKELVLEIISS